MNPVPAWAWLTAILVAFVLGGLMGYDYGTSRRDASAGREAVKQVDKIERRESVTESARQASTTRTAQAQVKSQEATQDGQQQIQYIYRDRRVPVPTDCRPAPGVRDVIDAAHARAAGAVRTAAGLDPADVPVR